MPVNMMDKSWLVVPWEYINEYMWKAELNHFLLEPAKVVNNFTGLIEFNDEGAGEELYFDPHFHGGHY